MAGKRAPENEEYVTLTHMATTMRGVVAQQVRDLVRDRDRVGSRGELAMRIEQVIGAERQIAEALGRQQQAQVEGMALAPHVEAEEEARVLLRQAAMELSVAAASWAVAMDFAARERRVPVLMNGGLNGSV